MPPTCRTLLVMLAVMAFSLQSDSTPNSRTEVDISGFGTCQTNTRTIFVKKAWAWTQYPAAPVITSVPFKELTNLTNLFVNRNSIVYSTQSEPVGFNVEQVVTRKNETQIKATNLTTVFPHGPCHFTLDPVPVPALFGAFRAFGVAVTSTVTSIVKAVTPPPSPSPPLPSPPPSSPPSPPWWFHDSYDPRDIDTSAEDGNVGS